MEQQPENKIGKRKEGSGERRKKYGIKLGDKLINVKLYNELSN